MSSEIPFRFADLYGKIRTQLASLPQLLHHFLPIIILAIGLTILSMLWIWHSAAAYKPVFGLQEKVIIAEMISVLDKEGIAYRIHPQTGQILVPEGQLGEIRILLAAKGVVAKLPAGLELVDKSDPLGVSQFVQNVRFRRGLEGELTKSIMALDSVEDARVHLSIARSGSFVASDHEKSSASVIVMLKPGKTLSREQISAIINLVSGSVANLEPQRVVLVDQFGHFLSSHLDFSDTDPLGIHDELVVRLRELALRNIRELLVPTLGEENFKVGVTVEVDNDRIEETRERYGDVPRITNESVQAEQIREGAVLGIPGSLSNRPVYQDASMPAQSAGPDTKNATMRQYAYDRSITQIKHGRGQLKKLSVAVIINNAIAPKGGWTSQQLLSFDKILRSGLGMEASRGDSLVVSALTFPSAQQQIISWWKDKDLILKLGYYLVYALGLLLAFLFLVRPFANLLCKKLNIPLKIGEVGDNQDRRKTGTKENQSVEDCEKAEDNSISPQESGMTMLLEEDDWPPIHSNIEVLVRHLKHLGTKEPERVSALLKQWVQGRE